MRCSSVRPPCASVCVFTASRVCAQLKEVDTDNSGTIDIDEFMVAMKAKHGDVDQEEVTQPRTMSRSYAPFLLAEEERECDSDVGCRRGVTSCGST